MTVPASGRIPQLERSPGGPPEAAMTVSPARASRLSIPINWPWLIDSPSRCWIDLGPHLLGPGASGPGNFGLVGRHAGRRPARARSAQALQAPVVASATIGRAPCLYASCAAHVDTDEPDLGMAEARLRAGGEIGQPGADGDHQVGRGDNRRRGSGSLESDATQGDGRDFLERPLPANVSPTGMPRASANS